MCFKENEDIGEDSQETKVDIVAFRLTILLERGRLHTLLPGTGESPFHGVWLAWISETKT